MLIVCQNALRCLEVIKDLKALPGTRVAKLFARHLKAPECAQALKQSTFQIGVGTPNRLVKLLKDFPDALVMRNLEVCILDTTYRDKKTLGILQLDDVRRDLVALAELLCHDVTVDTEQGEGDTEQGDSKPKANKTAGPIEIYEF